MLNIPTDTPASKQPNEFRSFELSGWQHSCTEYRDSFGPLTSQLIGPILDLLSPKVGSSFLDIATGPGYLAAAAAQRGANVVGVDFSENMISLARTLAPTATFEIGDAEALRFESQSFDSVSMNFGILHFARPQLALEEAARVAVPNGSFAFSCWNTPDKALGFQAVLGAIGSHGAKNVSLPDGPPFFFFSNPDNGVAALRSAGFRDIQVLNVPLMWKFADANAFFNAFLDGTARTGGLLRAQPASNLCEIRVAVIEAVSRDFQGDEGISVPMPALLYSARR